jgi:hypothetical protein
MSAEVSVSAEGPMEAVMLIIESAQSLGAHVQMTSAGDRASTTITSQGDLASVIELAASLLEDISID